MAKVNRYECGLCGEPIQNGREYSVTIHYPVPYNIKTIDTYTRKSRKTRKFELCEECFAERLKEFNQ